MSVAASPFRNRLTFDDKPQSSNTSTRCNSCNETLASTRGIRNIRKVVLLDHGYGFRDSRSSIRRCRTIFGVGRSSSSILLYGF